MVGVIVVAMSKSQFSSEHDRTAASQAEPWYLNEWWRSFLFVFFCLVIFLLVRELFSLLCKTNTLHRAVAENHRLLTELQETLRAN